jgi:NADH:ubiquinone oxidoreductase subunit 2 (subunit N)
MNSAIIWILLPGLLGIGLLLYRPRDRFPQILAGLLSLFLTWIAWQLPIDVVLNIGPFSFEIFPSLSFFGRSFTLTSAAQPLLTFIYFFQTLWIAGTVVAKPAKPFVPISLICVSLFVAALSVDPFLYAAILIALAILALIPLLSLAGEKVRPGVLRFMIFQIFAVPFILFTGWILSGVEASPGNLDLILRSGLLLLLGFTFLLGLFPFHSWIPMLARESHPYVVGFLLFFLPTISTVFALGFFDRYAWLRESQFVYQILTLIGGLSVLLSGLWAFVERHLGRLLGYAAMMGVGFSLLGIGQGVSQGAQLFFALLLPQSLGLWVLAVSLGSLNNKKVDLSLDGIADAFADSPLTVIGLILAVFSLAGLPLLASFPPRVDLLANLSTSAPWAAIIALLGSLGLAVAGVKLVLAVIRRSSKPQSGWVEEIETEAAAKAGETKDPFAWAFIILAGVGFLGFGLFSRFFLASVPDFASMFPLLFP